MNHTATHQKQVHMSKDQWVKYLWVGFAFVLLGILISMPSVSYANNTTYYINNQSGSNCSNGGSGTSTSQPWCDFTNVNSTTFQPGDNILLARGAVWNQLMELRGSGTSISWITVDAYGSGARPKIQRNNVATDRTIKMYDTSYWSINNLEISLAGQGIVVDYTTLNNEGLHFYNLYIHDIDLIFSGSPSQADGWGWHSIGIGIQVKNAPVPSSTEWILRDIEISNVETSNVTQPLKIDAGNYPDGSTGHQANSFQDIKIKNVYFHHYRGSIALRNLSNLTWMDSRIENGATAYQPQGTTGMFVWITDDLTFVNNVFKTVPDTNAFDMSWIDHEGYDNNSKFYSNFISAAAGSGLEYLALSSRPGDYNTNHIVKGNVFSGNNTSGGTNYKSSLYRGETTSASFTGTASDNLYYEPSGFLNNSSLFSDWTLTNNQSFTSANNLYHAGNGYSGTQGTNGWSYQLYDGASYSNLSYDSTNQWWGSSTAYVSRFNQLPNSTSSNWIARVWTAPSSGSISIRGRVLKNDIAGGDGVKVRITKNGSVIWLTSGTPQSIAYNDSIGVETNLDSISVTANDVIRFEVNNGGSGNATNDLTSWSPSVAYTSMGGGSGTNLAPSATLSVDSTNSTYTKDKAVDGIKNDSNSRWISENTAEPHWFQLDWTSNKTIDNVKVWSGHPTSTGWQIYDYTIQYWNGSSWVTVSTVDNNTSDAALGQYNNLSFSEVTTSKIRMHITDGVNQAGYTDARLLEIEVWGTEAVSSTNLAPSATLSVDSTNSTYTKDKAVDGIKNDSNSRWISENTAEPHWFQLDWSSNKTISNAKVWSGSMAGAGWQIYDYTIQYWDGSSWVTVATVDNNTQDGYNGQFNDLNFTAVTTNKIRMHITDGVNQAGSTDARLLEIEVWGN